MKPLDKSPQEYLEIGLAQIKEEACKAALIYDANGLKFPSRVIFLVERTTRLAERATREQKARRK